MSTDHLTARDWLQLARLAARAASDPTSLAYAIARSQRERDQSDESLAAELRCDLRTLTRIRLCALPVGEPARVAEGIREVAEKLGCDTVALARIVLG